VVIKNQCMSKLLLLSAMLFFGFSNLHAQVKIGSPGTPNTNAVLELDGGTSKGLLLPKLTATEITALTTAPDGLIIYNKTDNFLYIRKSAAWQKVSDETNGGGGLTLPYAGTASTVGGAEFSITHTTTFGDVAYFNNTAGGAAITTAAGNNKFNMTSGNMGIGIPAGLGENPTLGRLVVRGSVGSTVAVFDDRNTGISLQSNLPAVGFNEYYNAGSKYTSIGFGGKLALQTSNGDLGWYVTNVTGTAAAAATLNQRFGITRSGSMFIQGADAGYIFRDRTSTNYAGWNWYADAGKASLYRYNIGGNTITVDSTGAMGLQGITAITAPLTMANSTGSKIDFFYVSPTSRYGIGLQGSLLQMYSGSVADDIAFGYGASTMASFKESMRIKGNGKVGIGTSTPGSKLEVIESSAGFGLNVNQTGTGYAILAQNNGSLASLFAYNAGDGPAVITLGRAGINNVDPAFTLDVAGRMRLRNESVGSTAGVWLDGPTLPTRSFIGTFDNNRMGFYGTGSGWSLMMDVNDGALMIGTSQKATGYKVNVGGKIIAEEVRVQLKAAWPDYVFDDQYKKLSLDELEKYVAVNKHLPNIPSAADIEKDGQQLGEVQRKMLEKIEELNLYIIELNNKIKALEKKQLVGFSHQQTSL
jgi:hypothetical protein